MAEHETTRELNVPADRALAVLTRIDAYAERFGPCVASRVTRLGVLSGDRWEGEALLRVELADYPIGEDVTVKFCVRADTGEVETLSRAASIPGRPLGLRYRVEPLGPGRCRLHVRLSHGRLGFRLLPLSFASVRERLVRALATTIERAAERVEAGGSLIPVADEDARRRGCALTRVGTDGKAC